MIRKNLNLLISLIAFCMVSAGLSLWSSIKNDGPDQFLFRLAEDVKIDKVIIKKADAALILNGSASGWRVNEKHPADLDRVRLMFAVMDRSRPRRMAEHQEGFNVRFMEGSNLILDLLVWENKMDGRTWFATNENQMPAEMAIPGYRTGIISAFSVIENDWRNRRVFNFNWRNFVSLKAEFSGASENDFRISVNDGLLSVEDVPQPDTVNLKNYVDAIQLLESDAIVTGNIRQADSLKLSQPLLTLTVSEVSGKLHQLRFFDDGLALVDTTDVVVFNKALRRVLTAGKKTFMQGSPGGSSGRGIKSGI
ncbi:MAG: hypothetical protein ACO3FI_04715 [Cyclobacteriaceae bacterium]